MSRPLNEYPKEELEYLLSCISSASRESSAKQDYAAHAKASSWFYRIKEAISDREFEDSKLPDERK